MNTEVKVLCQVIALNLSEILEIPKDRIGIVPDELSSVVDDGTRAEIGTWIINCQVFFEGSARLTIQAIVGLYDNRLTLFEGYRDKVLAISLHGGKWYTTLEYTRAVKTAIG